jgi:hypothetical protein
MNQQTHICSTIYYTVLYYTAATCFDVQNGPEAHPASCTIGTWSSPEVNSGRDMILTPHPLLVPWSWKGRAIPLIPLWAVRPVQSLRACTTVHFTVRPVQSLRACTTVRFNFSFYLTCFDAIASSSGSSSSETAKLHKYVNAVMEIHFRL